MADITRGQPAASLIFIPFDPVGPKGSKSRALSGESDKPKRRLITEEEKANIKAVKAKGACLRCRILKKHCDDEQHCKQCPAQSLESPGDYWKVLGCHRGELSNLVDNFVPAWLEQDSREAILPGGQHLDLHLVSRPSARPNENQDHPEISRDSPSDTSWFHEYTAPYKDDERRPAKQTFTNLRGYGWMAALELSRLQEIDNVYWRETAFDPVRLLQNMQDAEDRDANATSVSSNSSIWELSRRIIIGACAAYQREAQCRLIVKDVCDHKAKWDQTDIIVDVRTYSTPNLREDLKLCFEIFQKTCSKRNSIEPFQWPSIFYFLTAIGIVKSIMIDIQVLPLYYNCGPKQDMVYIQSTYNALVSIFAWATGPLEPLLADHSRVIIADRAATLQEMRKLIRIDHWAVWNIKSTRDFLMRLGEGYFFDGTFNGFIVQEQVLVHNFTEKDAGTVQLHHISSTIGRSAEKRRSQVDTMQDLLDMLPDGGKFDTDRPYSRVPLNTEAGDAALAQDTSSSTSASRVIFPKSKCSDCTEIESSEARSFRSFMHREVWKKELQRAEKHVGMSSSQSRLRSPPTALARVNMLEEPAENSPSLKSAISSLKGSFKSHGSPMSISSWTRDIIMSGMSSSSWRSLSTSNKSATSVQRLEANFMRDFRCCGQELPTLHDLQEHRKACYEQNAFAHSVIGGEKVYEKQNELAKRLDSLGSAFGSQRTLQQQFPSVGLDNVQFASDDLMRRFRQQQQMWMQRQGLGNGAAPKIVNGEEGKPFRCPVIGCEKAYKNQNGMRFHKTHGHQHQILHENGDGTFSIINPETSELYPGTLGMEKDKPYKCVVCGKRYKNLNGFKYHKSHSPSCNPEMNQVVESVQGGLRNVVLTEEATGSQ